VLSVEPEVVHVVGDPAVLPTIGVLLLSGDEVGLEDLHHHLMRRCGATEDVEFRPRLRLVSEKPRGDLAENCSVLTSLFEAVEAGVIHGTFDTGREVFEKLLTRFR
jgi:hypothetical protein